MTYLGTSKFPTHKECIHFNSGLCTLNNVPVDPNQPTCPNFTPKNITLPPQTSRTYQQPQPYPQPYPLYYPYTSPSSVGYSSPPMRVDLSSARYSYRRHYGSRHTPTKPMQSNAIFTFMFGGGGRGGGAGRGGGSGGGRGRMGGFAAGPGGQCVCPKCGYTVSHKLGVPCFQQTCPKCGTPLIRKS
ncbi:MAG: hypothetical protein U9O89_01985 [Thermoproteota archaeon]|nr:hypothetical protein [Thermoproteota archaeon]